MGSHQNHEHHSHHEHHERSGRHAHHAEGPHAESQPHQDVSSCSQTPSAVLAPMDKLTKMVEHWLHHNQDHARSFSDWAERARGLGRTDVAVLIEDAARQSLAQNELFQKALDLLNSAPRETA
jgi:ATP-dependent exoDNAse (exonuclease V) beta subunit